MSFSRNLTLGQVRKPSTHTHTHYLSIGMTFCSLPNSAKLLVLTLQLHATHPTHHHSGTPFSSPLSYSTLQVNTSLTHATSPLVNSTTISATHYSSSTGTQVLFNTRFDAAPVAVDLRLCNTVGKTVLGEVPLRSVREGQQVGVINGSRCSQRRTA